MAKKVVDFNNSNDIAQLYDDIKTVQGMEHFVVPIHKAINILQDYKEENTLSTEQIRKIYDNLKINEHMTPEEMNRSMDASINQNTRIAVIEKKFLQATINRTEFSAMIESIMNHFNTVISGPILTAIKQIIDNFSCICLMARNQFSFQDVCFKFFTRDKNNEILVLVLNIQYDQTSFVYKFLNLCKFKKLKIHLNFFGTIVKTDFPQLNF